MNLKNVFGRVLIIAAHADDETLGCGGLITKLKERNIDCHIHIATGSGGNKHPIFPEKEFKIIKNEFKNAILHLGNPSFSFGNLPAAMLNDFSTYKINADIENLIDLTKPNTIFIPSQNDLHLDHKILNYAAKVASRPYLKNNSQLKGLIEYEVPSETNIYFDNANDIFRPNLYVDISSELEYKLKAFSEYKSQLQTNTQPRSIEGLKSLASYRGINIGAKFAEAYKIIYKKI